MFKLAKLANILDPLAPTTSDISTLIWKTVWHKQPIADSLGKTNQFMSDMKNIFKS